MFNRFAGFNDILKEIAHFENTRSRNSKLAGTNVIQVDDVSTGDGYDWLDDFSAGGDYRASVRES